MTRANFVPIPDAWGGGGVVAPAEFALVAVGAGGVRAQVVIMVINRW